MDSIVFESVHKVFRQRGFFFLRKPEAETHALKGLSLTVAPGEVLGLLGPNGSGKSTTLKLISTMLLPDRGHVVVQGCDTRRQGQAVGLAGPARTGRHRPRLGRIPAGQHGPAPRSLRGRPAPASCGLSAADRPIESQSV